MIPDKTKKLIEWLESSTQPSQHFSLADIKEIISIAMTEVAEKNDKSFESLPNAIVEDIIIDMKASGEYYRLEHKI